jgi:hypothetical protein
LTIAEGFNNRSPQLPSEVAGAIDCREMCISVSRNDQQSYINRKLFLSIKLQAIVDNSGKFMDTFVGWPGRSHDARAFTNSPFYHSLCNNYRDLLPTTFFIVGDSAYPLKNFLMTPFKHLSATTQQHR